MEECEFEKGRALTIRIQAAGTRQVCIVSGTTLKTFMETQKGMTAVNGGEGLRNFVKQMSVNTLEELCRYTKVFTATVGPLSVLVTPFDSLVMELTNKDEEMLGYRVSLFLKSDFEGGAMESINEWHISVRKPNQFLSSAVEALALAGAD